MENIRLITTINKKTIFTRMCIAEAIIDLLEKNELDKLKISDIVKKAGVARMTFYKYYDSPISALTDYLNMIIHEYICESNNSADIGEYLKQSHIEYSLLFFDKYSKYFLTLAKHGLHSILLNGINRFMTENVHFSNKLSIYEMYCYSGGLLNTFLKWEENGKREKASDVAATVYKLYGCAFS